MEQEFVWVFNKPDVKDVVQLPEPPKRERDDHELWWNVMLVLLRFFT